MYAERYDRKSAIKPGSLAVAVAINAAVLGAVLLTPMEVFTKAIDRPFEGTNIPLPPEPKPIEADPKPKTATSDPSPSPRPVTPDPIVDNPLPPGVDLTGTSEIIGPPPGIGDGGTGTGVGIDPPAPPPVFIDPSFDSRYASDFQPSYPAREQALERDGSVVVRVLVGIDGRVKAVEAESATSDAFFEATRRTALSKWRFRPATRNGVPIERWKTVRVTFRLQDA